MAFPVPRTIFGIQGCSLFESVLLCDRNLATPCGHQQNLKVLTKNHQILSPPVHPEVFQLQKMEIQLDIFPLGSNDFF